MRHHKYNPSFRFVENPVEFNKYTEKELLQYCLGATLYMPGTQDFVETIRQGKMQGLTSMVMCFEDAVAEADVPSAEESAIGLLDAISSDFKNGDITHESIPLIFFRVRSLEQFLSISKRIKAEHMSILVGFVFPKFTSDQGEAYYSHLKELNMRFGDILYGMPLLENESVAYKETRLDELMKSKAIIDKYKEYTLNIRVGATDFSSCFGMRRDIEYTIYDIIAVRDCLADILNIFGRNNDYVISGPVWEYFGAGDIKIDCNQQDIVKSLLTRELIVSEPVDGLLREVILDKANGFIGKTIIHPTHLRFANAMQAVTTEEHADAMQVLGAEGGVIKSAQANKMNEIKPHLSWANSVRMRALAYGIIRDKSEYLNLFHEEIRA